MNHLRPLALSDYCKQAIVISLFPIPETPKVSRIAPPSSLCRLVGETPARLLVFVFTAVKLRPDVVGGFHLIPNGLIAAVLAPLVGAQSLYFCGGGPREVAGGGILGNRALEDVKVPDRVSEARLLRAMNGIDRVICMGNRTCRYYRSRGVTSRFDVIPGGIDARRFDSANIEKVYDLIFVGRLVQVKRVDLFLETIALLAESLPEVRAAVVGGGELENELKVTADRLGITKCVVFAGEQPDVIPWLKRSRVFVLTSDSEGLSLAMMEALTCGLPCVVADVGELGEVIKNGVNGFLVSERTGAAFAKMLQSIIRNEVELTRLSGGAKSSARSFELNQTVDKWNRILSAG